eukprot:scaffold43883_cov32-Tisochrysis_lutea.AAC.4
MLPAPGANAPRSYRGPPRAIGGNFFPDRQQPHRGGNGGWGSAPGLSCLSHARPGPAQGALLASQMVCGSVVRRGPVQADTCGARRAPGEGLNE